MRFERQFGRIKKEEVPEFPEEAKNIFELAEQLRAIDERHGLKTERGIEEYAEVFDTVPEELLEGRVLNIGDPFLRLSADFFNVVTLDYFYGIDVRSRIEEVKKDETISEERKQEIIEMYQRWKKLTRFRIEKGAKAVKGIFPVLPFKNESFDRVLSLNSISMHPFDEKGGFSKKEWQIWWNEILRVLKPGGKAFIGPFDRLTPHEVRIMERELEQMRDEGRLDFKIESPEDLDQEASFQGPDYVVIEKPEVREKKILPSEIREGLNSIREEDISFSDKAKKLAELLRRYGCEEIEVIDCDVCVTDFFPEFFAKLAEVYPQDYDRLPPERKEKVFQRMASLIPEEAKVRVHAQTPSGYLTWCFGCESTMCGNEVEYPENPDWDKIHKEKAREILLAYPEWEAEAFYVCGSARNRIVIDVVSANPELEFCSFDKEGLHISIHFINPKTFEYLPRYRDFFEEIETQA